MIERGCGTVGVVGGRLVEELLFVEFVGDVVFEGTVCYCVCNCVLGEIAATIGCRVLLEFVQFSNGLTPSVCYCPIMVLATYTCEKEDGRVPMFSHDHENFEIRGEMSFCST